MKRWLAMAALVAALLAAPVWAQHRGGASAGSISRGGMAVHGAGMAVHGAGMAVHGAGLAVGGSGFSAHGAMPFGAQRFGVHSGATFGPHRPLIYPNRYYRRGSYGYPWAYGYPGFYSDYEYPSADTTYPGYNPSASYVDPNIQYQQQDQVEQKQIYRLENEVEQLREDRARSNAAANSQPQPPTVVVFQDKHTEAVQNYAIVGETLWIFTEARARKIPLSDIDVSATQKANEDRGVDFRLPE
jgi:hypothetical protein